MTASEALLMDLHLPGFLLHCIRRKAPVEPSVGCIESTGTADSIGSP